MAQIIITAQISSSLPKGGPSLSPVTCWIFKHCMQSLQMRKFPTYTHLFNNFEANFWWRGDGKALFQTDSQNSLKSHPSVTFFLELPLHPEGKVSTCMSAVFWERTESSFILKRNRHIPPGDGFTLPERKCPCHFHFLWGSLFSVLQFLRKFLKFL